MAITIEINTEGRNTGLFPKETKINDPALAKVLRAALGDALYVKFSSRFPNRTLGVLSRLEVGDLADYGFTPQEEALLIKTAKDLKEPTDTGAIAIGPGAVAAGAGGIAIGGGFDGTITVGPNGKIVISRK